MRQKVESLFNGITVNDAELKSRHWPDQRYVIFFTPRSGSSWLGVSGRDKTGTSAA